jgi:hypothetical protein
LFVGKTRLWINGHTKDKLQGKAGAVESKDFLVQKIRHTVEQEIRPFELLDILNHHRPDTVLFSSAIVDNIHNVVVEGVAETASDVEEFRQNLQESHRFESIKVGSITTGNQGAKFNLFCDFKEIGLATLKEEEDKQIP